MIQITMIRITYYKMRMMFCQKVFKAGTMTSELLDRLHLSCNYLGLMP
jgi:hypothetical protein